MMTSLLLDFIVDFDNIITLEDGCLEIITAEIEVF